MAKYNDPYNLEERLKIGKTKKSQKKSRFGDDPYNLEERLYGGHKDKSYTVASGVKIRAKSLEETKAELFGKLYKPGASFDNSIIKSIDSLIAQENQAKKYYGMHPEEFGKDELKTVKELNEGTLNTLTDLKKGPVAARYGNASVLDGLEEGSDPFSLYQRLLRLSGYDDVTGALEQNTMPPSMMRKGVEAPASILPEGYSEEDFRTDIMNMLDNPDRTTEQYRQSAARISEIAGMDATQMKSGDLMGLTWDPEYNASLEALRQPVNTQADMAARLQAYSPEDLKADLLTIEDYYNGNTLVSQTDFQRAVERFKAYSGKNLGEFSEEQIKDGSFTEQGEQQRAGEMKQLNAVTQSVTDGGMTFEEYLRYLEKYAANDMAQNADAVNQAEWENTIERKYGALDSMPDFKQNSQYDEEFAADPMYALIVGTASPEEAMGLTASGAEDPSGRANEYWTYGIAHMTDAERRRYAYLYYVNGKAAADEYLSDLMWDLGRRRAEEVEQVNAEFADARPVLASAASVISNAARGFAQPLAAARELIAGDVGEYDPMFAFGRAADAARQTVGEKIDEAMGGANIAGIPIGSALYNALMSAADSAMMYPIGAQAGAALMGLEASNAAMQQALEAGRDGKSALLDSAVYGGIEGLTEQLPLEKLFGSVGSPIKYLGQNVATEAAEEAISEIAGTAYDIARYGEDSTFGKLYAQLIAQGYSEGEAMTEAWTQFAKNVAESASVGGLAGGMGAAPRAAITAATDRKAAKNIQNNDAVDQVLEVARTMEQTPEIRALLDKAKNTSLSKAELGRVFRETAAHLDDSAGTVMSDTLARDVEATLDAKGMKGDAEVIHQTARAVAKAVYKPEMLTAVERENIARSGEAVAALNELTGKIRSFDQLAAKGNKQIRPAAVDMPQTEQDVANIKVEGAKEKNYAGLSVGEVDVSGINMRTLTKHQRYSVAAIGRVAKAVGFNVRFVESVANKEGKYTTENGSWNSDSMTMTLDIHAGSNTASDVNYAMMQTAGHELTHYIREFADGEMWQEYQDFVTAHLTGKMGIQSFGDEIQARMANAERQGNTLEYDAALEEVVADASVEALMNISESDLLEIANSNSNFIKRVGGFIKSWVSNVRKMIERAFAGTQTRPEVAIQMRDALDELSAKWNRMLVQASKNANRARAELESKRTAEAAAERNAQTDAMEKTVEETVQEAAEEAEEETAPRFLVHAHIDNRTPESVRSVDTELFSGESDEARVGFAAAARMLLADVENSVSGQKFFSDDSVTGQKRMTSRFLAQMKDSTGWTWDKIRNILQQFVDSENGKLPKNTATNREMELYLDEVLSNGYTTIDGVKVSPWDEYIAGKAAYEGAQKQKAPESAYSGAVDFVEYAYADVGSGEKFSLREGIEFAEDKYYSRMIDHFEEQKPHGYIKVGKVGGGSILREIGLPEADLYFDNAKINRALNDHADHVSKEVLKQIPSILRNPVVVAEEMATGDVNVFGDLMIGNSPVLVGIVVTHDRSGKNVINKVRTIHARRDATKKISDESVLYLSENKKRTRDWFQAQGTQLPLRGTKFGFIRSIARGEENVKFSLRDEQTDTDNPDIRYQLRDPNQISDRELLANAMESAAANADELDFVRRYKNHIADLNEKQMALEDTNRRIVALRKADEKGNRDAILKLQANADTLSKQVDRYDKKLLSFEAAKPLKAVAERERERVRKLGVERTRKVREQYKQKVKDEAQRVREVGERRVERMRESAGKEKYRERIKKDVNTMRTWLTTPTNKGHVPEFLRASLGEFLESLDFSSARSLNGGDATQADARMLAAMERMREALRRVRQDQSGLDSSASEFKGYIDLPGNLEDNFDKLVRSIRATIEGTSGLTDTAINRMTSEQLKTLSESIRAINTAVRNMNRLLVNAKYESAIKAAQATIKELDSLGEKKDRIKAVDSVSRFMNWKNTVPFYAFKRFGAGGKAIFEGMMDGWDKLARNAKELIDYADKSYTTKEVRKWSREVHSIELASGETVRMTTAQMMSLYCLSKREQAVGHLMGGGIRVGTISLMGKEIRQSANYTLSMSDLANISGMLTQRQREVADRLQEFMNTRSAEWGNEVSMKRFGYEMFTEENYFPIETDANNRKAVDEQAQENSLFRLLNLSATKPLAPNARNAIVIRDVFDVFTAHCSDMAKYNALGLPILDALKWYNYVEITGNVTDDKKKKQSAQKSQESTGENEGNLKTKSVQKSLESAYGDEAKRYIVNLLRDLNGVNESGRNDGFINKLISNAKVASVGANARVYLLQATSLPRAAYAISPKYLSMGLASAAASPKRSVEEAERMVGIAQWKALGFYDTNISRSIREMVKHDTNVIGKIREWSMSPAGMMDKLTLGIIYRSVQAEMRSQHSGVAVGSAEYNRMVNNRVREIVYQTQVVDSTMTRSDMMRGKGIATLATAFMSEPTLSMNMLNDSLYEAQMNRRRKEPIGAPMAKFTKAMGVYAFTAVLVAMLESVFDAERDDDEYETFGEKFMSAFITDATDQDSTWKKIAKFMTANLGSNLNPLNNIPVVSDVMSIVEGYDSAPLYTAFVASFKNTWDVYQKYLSGEGGYTLYNVIYNALKGVSQMIGLPIGNTIREAVALWNTFIADRYGKPRIQTYTDSKTQAAQAYYTAIANGDMQRAAFILERARLYGIGEGDVRKEMTGFIKDDYISGDFTEAKARDWLAEYAGKDDGDIDGYIRDWTYARETGRQYNDMKADYIAGAMTKEEAQTLLVQYRGYDSEKVYWTLREWDYAADHGGDSDGWTKYSDFLEAAEAGKGYEAYARELLNHGADKSDIARAIAGHFKEEYGAVHGTAAGDRMLEKLLDVYEAIGYDRAYERRYITNNWLE